MKITKIIIVVAILILATYGSIKSYTKYIKYDKPIFETMCEGDIKPNIVSSDTKFKLYGLKSNIIPKSDALFMIDTYELIADEILLHNQDSSYKKMFSSLRNSIDNISYIELQFAIQKIFAKFNNNLIKVKGLHKELFLPIDIKNIDNNYYAFKSDGLFFQEYPLIVSINDTPIKEWIEKSKLFSNRGLESIEKVALELGVDIKNGIKIRVSNIGRDKTKDVELNSVNKEVVYKFSPKNTKLKDIEYIKIEKMYKKKDYMFKEALKGFYQARDKKGIIIDLRGSSGINSDIVTNTLPLILEKPQVISVAKIKRSKVLKDKFNCDISFLNSDLLSSMGFKEYKNLEKRDKMTVDIFNKQTTPYKNFSKEYLSEPLYITVKPDPQPFLKDKKIVVIVDRDTKGSAKLLINSIKDLKNVTVIGESSSKEYNKVLTYKIVPKSGDRNLVQFLDVPSSTFIFKNGNYSKKIETDITLKYSLDDLLGDDDSMVKYAISLIEKG